LKSKVHRYTLQTLLTVLLATACTRNQDNPPATQDNPPSSQQASIWVYDCGSDFKFTARFRDNQVILDLPSETLTLPQVISASGARFSNEAVTFWEKGREASLEGGAYAYQGCKASAAQNPWEAAGLMGVTYRAIGQEPGWMLQIQDGKRILLIADYGENRVSAEPAPAPQSLPGGGRRYEAQTGSGTLSVVIENKPCNDVMSGEPFPDTVTVMLNGRQYHGCGRSLER
jgi:membrane-bound inhibitor of C-type lysozyme